MEVKAILDHKGREVATTRPEVSVLSAANRMRASGIGALVVCEDDKTVLGIIDERQIVWAFGEHGGDIAALRVADVMRTTVATCRPSDDLKAVMTKVTTHRVRHIPVTEGGRLIGMISIGDIVKSRLQALELETNVLRDIAIAHR